MRHQDLAIGQLENHPEGFNALRRMYEDVQEPMMQSFSTPTTSTPSSSSSTGTSPNNAALPNPWGRQTSAAPGNTMQPPFGFGGSMPMPMPMPGMGAMDPAVMQGMLNNPAVMQQVQAMMSNPAMVQQMAAMHPELGGMLNNPQIRAMLSNPQMLQQMINPANMQAMMQVT